MVQATKNIKANVICILDSVNEYQGKQWPQPKKCMILLLAVYLEGYNSLNLKTIVAAHQTNKEI